MNLKKPLLLTLTEILFFALIIASLTFVRYETKLTLAQAETFAPDISRLQGELNQNNLSEDNIIQLSQILDNLEKVTSKSLILTNYFFPIFLVIISVLFQMIYWKILSNTKIKIIIIPVIIQTLIFILTLNLYIELFTALFVMDPLPNTFLLIIAPILLIASTLFNIFYFSINKTIKQTIKAISKSRIIVWLNLMLLLLLLLTIVFIAIFIYGFIQVSFSVALYPIFALIVFSLVSNIHRIYVVSKINVIK